jgi:hypothetical protein
MKRAGSFLVLAAVVAASACNNDPSKQPPKYRLEGSLTSVMELGYDEARVLVAPTDISLLFVRIKPLGGSSEDGGVVDPMMQGTSEDYPLRLGYRFPVEGLDGGRIDLAELDGNDNQRGVASRTVQNDPRNVLPPLARGTLFFDQPLLPNAVVRGDFHITFENGVEAASGRTAFSTSFTARVQP